MGNGIFFLPVLDKTEFNSSPHIYPSTSLKRRRGYPIDSSGALVTSHPSLSTECVLEDKRQKRGREKKRMEKSR